jgi:redox-sensitive bicupin YhaK (pirin superfamily)
VSWRPAQEPVCHPAHGVIAVVISPREKDLGGFSVRRVLPAVERRTVGPFVFFDHMGPATFPPGEGINVRPHPHIGLATVTYLFEGEILHRDSLGSELPIRPGAVNWMTAGRGIVHSERTSDEEIKRERRLHGIQTWVALPLAHEEDAPAFEHIPADRLPVFRQDDAELRLIAGCAYGRPAPFETVVDLFYMEGRIDPGGSLNLPATLGERCVYLVGGGLTIAERALNPTDMAVLEDGSDVVLSAGPEGAHVMLAGGAPLDGPRHIFWNFVSSSKERIEQAKTDWQDGRFSKVPGDEEEFIPLPG